MDPNVDQRLTALLYLLVRDHLPSGVVVKLVEESKLCDDPRFTDSNIEAFARDMLRRLKG